jgi:serine/threonine-protein kinase
MTKRTGQQTSLVGRVLHNTYRIERLIGEGGIGVVYEASHLRLVRRFAVKMLSGEVSEHPEDLARFKREALITSALGHPHILEMIDFNETDDGMPYLVMELLDGEDLARRLKRVGRLPLGQVASIFQQAASALEAVHQKGIIHRDLKPPNIFLCRRGERDDFVKIVDFGISKVLGFRSQTTETHGLPGTPHYMSPEQVEQKTDEMGLRSDVFAMATILYVMLSGQPPFRADSLPGVLFKIAYEEPPPLQALDPAVPESIAAAISKAMRKNPEERFSSMRAFWQEFESALEREGVEFSEPPNAIWAREDPDRTQPPDQLLTDATAQESSAGTGLAGVTQPLSTFSSSAAEVMRATASLRWKRVLGWAGALAAALLLGMLATKVVRDSCRRRTLPG